MKEEIFQSEMLLLINVFYSKTSQVKTLLYSHTQKSMHSRCAIRPRLLRSHTKNEKVFPLRLQIMSAFTQMSKIAVVCVPGR